MGSGVTLLGTDDPVRVFQRFSTLSALSQGRTELTVGRGAFLDSFRLFGFDPKAYDTLFADKLQALSTLLRQTAAPAPPRGTAPASRPAVYPPLEHGPLPTWLAVGATPASVLRAAQYGMPMMLGIVGGPPARFAHLVECYRSASIQAHGNAGTIGVHAPGFVGEADAAARELFWQAYQPVRERHGAELGWPAFDARRYDTEVQQGALFVGGPETVARRIATTMHTLGATRFDLRFTTGALPAAAQWRCIELYGRRVVPRVRELLSK